MVIFGHKTPMGILGHNNSNWALTAQSLPECLKKKNVIKAYMYETKYDKNTGMLNSSLFFKRKPLNEKINIIFSWNVKNKCM